MIVKRAANDRGHANHGWLETYHTFSFADYYDPQYMGFRGLRVINEDRVLPGRGFGTHPHRDMEIVTYVLEGALEHRDSMGNGSVIRPLDIQRMSAGRGITHSEFNASASEVVHLLQIWIMPERLGIEPSYEQNTYAKEALEGRLQLIASPDGREGSVILHADVRLYAGRLSRGTSSELQIAAGRYAWVQVARGHLRLNGCELGPSDGAAVSDIQALRVEVLEDAEVLVFDLA